MKRVAFACCLFVWSVLTAPLVAAGNPRIFGQEPSLDDWGVINAVPADKTCNVACSPPQSLAYAVASPGYDGSSVRFRINEIQVWGIYKSGPTDSGSPPAEDSFTVKVQLPNGGPFDLPGAEVCSSSAIAGTREHVDEILGYEVYRHTLQLPAPCVFTVPTNRVYWIQVFNDTGSADDWFWLGGIESFAWPLDCCWEHQGFASAVDINQGPGEEWAVLYTPLAFQSRTAYVGAAQTLLLSKLPGELLQLQWDGDCGGGGDFSVYRGELAEGISTLAPEPGHCDLSGTSATVPLGLGTADIFLAVPWVEAAYGSCVLWGSDHCRNQGSYGTDSDGVARPQPTSRCYWEASPQHDCAFPE